MEHKHAGHARGPRHAPLQAENVAPYARAHKASAAALAATVVCQEGAAIATCARHAAGVMFITEETGRWLTYKY